MPTNANAYNSRITDESLEKKFRDSFRSQGGAELVDDLYASGVIVPVIDFSSAASGSVLSQELQQAWDFTTGHTTVTSSATLISNAGFWQVDLNCHTSGNFTGKWSVKIFDGVSTKIIWETNTIPAGVSTENFAFSERFVVFLRSGDSLTASVTGTTSYPIDIWYRQIADISGNLVNPSGFTSS